jgi:hypothetical protein
LPIARTLMGATVLLCVLTACGMGDSLDRNLAADDETAAAGALSTFLQEERFTRPQAECIGKDLVDVFGLDHLTDLQVLTAQLQVQPAKAANLAAFGSKTDAPKAAAIVVDCITVAGMMKQQYQGIDDATAECLGKAFGRQRLVDAMAAGLQGVAAPDTPADVTEEMSKCVPKK